MFAERNPAYSRREAAENFADGKYLEDFLAGTDCEMDVA
jgi:hypothetical protein